MQFFVRSNNRLLSELIGNKTFLSFGIFIAMHAGKNHFFFLIKSIVADNCLQRAT